MPKVVRQVDFWSFRTLTTQTTAKTILSPKGRPTTPSRTIGRPCRSPIPIPTWNSMIPPFRPRLPVVVRAAVPAVAVARVAAVPAVAVPVVTGSS